MKIEFDTEETWSFAAIGIILLVCLTVVATRLSAHHHDLQVEITKTIGLKHQGSLNESKRIKRRAHKSRK